MNLMIHQNIIEFMKLLNKLGKKSEKCLKARYVIQKF